MKRAIRIIAIIVIVVVAIELATCVQRMSQSSAIALRMVQRECSQNGYDIHRLVGPVNGRVGSISYSWDYHDETHHLELLVWFNHFYEPKLAIWDYNRKD